MAMKRKFVTSSKAYKKIKLTPWKRYSRRARSRRSSFITSQLNSTSGLLYRGRKLRYKAYKRKVYNSTFGLQSNRSILSIRDSVVGTLSNLEKYYKVYEIPDNFYALAGGYTGTGTQKSDGKFVIKGGSMYIRFFNGGTAGTTMLEYECVLCRCVNTASSTTAPIIPAGVIRNSADWSHLPGYGQTWKVISRTKRFILEPNDVTRVDYRIPFTVLNNIADWSLSKGKLFILITATRCAAVAAAVIYEVEFGHNLTFTGDFLT